MEKVPAMTNILKETEPHKKYFQAFLLIVLFFSSCSSDDPGPQASVCKLTTQKTKATGNESPTVTYIYDYTLNHTYDEKSNYLGQTGSYSTVYSDGKTSSSSISISNQFDNNGFITRKIYQYSATDKDGVTYNQSYTTDYTYENERLSKEHTISINNGATKDYTNTYEYDTGGKLIKFSTTYDNSYTTFEYNNNIIVKITEVDFAGKSYSPFVEYNSNGWLVKSIETSGGGNTDETRYQYDSEGQMIRMERYLNGKPSLAYSSEYDNKEYPNTQISAPLKGHPDIPGTQAYTRPKHNVTKVTYYSGNATTNQWDVDGSSIFTLDYNSHNLPIDLTVNGLDKNGTQTNSTRTTYQYQDCQ